MKAVAFSRACFDKSNASCFSASTNSLAVGCFSGIGSGLSSG